MVKFPFKPPKEKIEAWGGRQWEKRGKNHMITLESSLEKIGNKVTTAKGFSG